MLQLVGHHAVPRVQVSLPTLLTIVRATAKTLMPVESTRVALKVGELRAQVFEVFMDNEAFESNPQYGTTCITLITDNSGVDKIWLLSRRHRATEFSKSGQLWRTTVHGSKGDT